MLDNPNACQMLTPLEDPALEPGGHKCFFYYVDSVLISIGQPLVSIVRHFNKNIYMHLCSVGLFSRHHGVSVESQVDRYINLLKYYG